MNYYKITIVSAWTVVAFWLELITIFIILLYRNVLDLCYHLNILLCSIFKIGSWWKNFLDASLLYLWCVNSLSLLLKVSFSIVWVKYFKDLVWWAFICSLKKLFDINCKFDSITSWSCSKIILASFKSMFPWIEMHSGHLVMLRISHI